jgi:hypothetical protein
MQLNPGSGAGILDDIDFICGTDSTSYSTADKVRNLNRHYHRGVADIMRTQGRQQFHDSVNLNKLPERVFTLVDGQHQYALPTDLLVLWAIEIKDANGNDIRLQEIDMNDPIMARTITDLRDTAGIPKYYDIRGEDFYLYPAPATADVTLSGGGRVFYTAVVDEFTTADTTQSPAISEPFQRLLSIGASLDWLLVNDTSKVDRWKNEYEQTRAEMRAFYSRRNRDVQQALMPAHNQHDYI